MRKRDYLTTDEVQHILRISKPTLLKKLATGEIPAERADKSLRAVWEIPPQSVADAINKERQLLNEQEKAFFELWKKASGEQWKQ